MTTSTTASASASSGSIEAATNAFESILSGEGQDTEEENEKAQQADEPADDEDEGDEPEASDDEGEEAQESEDEESEDESDDEEESDQDESEDPVYAVKVDGQEIEVPLSELVKGYSRTADYTRKTQQLAAERQQVLAQAAESSALREQYAQRLEQIDQFLQQQQPAEPDWETLRATDPIEFAAQWADHQRRQAMRQQVMVERQAVMQRQQAEQMMQTQQQLEQARQWLNQAIPEWSDQEKAKADRAAMKAYGTKFGYSDEELSQVMDPRAVVLLRKAMLYDQLQQRKSTIAPVKKTGKAAPVLKPSAASTQSTRKVSDTTRAKQRLAKTGNVRDAAKLFETLL